MSGYLQAKRQARSYAMSLVAIRNMATPAASRQIEDQRSDTMARSSAQWMICHFARREGSEECRIHVVEIHHQAMRSKGDDTGFGTTSISVMACSAWIRMTTLSTRTMLMSAGLCVPRIRFRNKVPGASFHECESATHARPQPARGPRNPWESSSARTIDEFDSLVSLKSSHLQRRTSQFI